LEIENTLPRDDAPFRSLESRSGGSALHRQHIHDAESESST
jgi:hypothetical protein